MRGLVLNLLFALLAVVLVLLGMFVHLGNELRHVVFASPLWLVLAALPVMALALRAWWAPRPATLRFSRVATLRRLPGGLVARLAQLPDGLRLAAALLAVVALARPQSATSSDRIEHEGIDIVVVLDLSESMQTMDLMPNRLGAAQQVIDEFISLRPRDRIGLVAFGAHASTVAPVTMDHDVLRALVKRLRLGVLDGSRTAIGAGLGVALNRLQESEADSQVIVLLTDGVHNAGGLDPDNAAQEAADRRVKVYTVLIGRHRGLMRRTIDPARLERIASITGGFAYTAEDQAALRTSFHDLLDRLERSVIEGEQVRAELFPVVLWPMLVLLVLDVLLRSTRLRRFP